MEIYQSLIDRLSDYHRINGNQLITTRLLLNLLKSTQNELDKKRELDDMEGTDSDLY